MRTDEAAAAASKVAAMPECRQALLEFQRRFAKFPPAEKAGAILDGRDIGTTILPDADQKFFLTANLEIRAQRRLIELQKLGIERILSSVLQDMQERDQRDSNRIESPLTPASDAYVMDTSEMNIDEVFDQCVCYVVNSRKVA